MVIVKLLQEFLQRKTHQEILTSFSLSDNHNVHAKHGTSLYGDVALRLNLPNIDVVRFSLSRWSKHFSNFVGTTGNERKGRRNEPITRRPPRKRPHLDIEDIPSSSMLQFCTIEFHTAVHQYPEKVCDLCHRMQYTLKALSTAGLNFLHEHFVFLYIFIYAKDAIEQQRRKISHLKPSSME